MRTKTIELYTIDELDETAKEKALDSMRYAEVDYDWWDFIFDDAKNIGLKISAFDIDHGKSINIDWTEGPEYTAEEILKNHGRSCDTYETANLYQKDRAALVEKYVSPDQPDRVSEGNEQNFDEECDDLDHEFLRALGEDYLSMLRQEYEHLTSDECILEFCQLNEMEFTKDGGPA